MDAEHNSALLKAAQDGNLLEMKRLVSLGAEVRQPGNDGPLVWAANNGHTECVRWLLDHGSDINEQYNGVFAPLWCAASQNKFDAVKLLVDRGADQNLLTNGKTALQIAQGKKYDDVARFLERTPDQVSYSWPLDNRVMQEVYHFPRLERVTLLRKSEGGDVETMQRESFASLGDIPPLRAAFEEHRRRGGKLAESDVFPDVLAKPKSGLRP
jgi:hypothetical protein